GARGRCDRRRVRLVRARARRRTRRDVPRADEREHGSRRGHLAGRAGDRMRRLALGAAVPGAWLALPAGAPAARGAGWLAHGADAQAVAAAVERRTGTPPESLEPIPALVVDLPADTSLRGIAGVRYVEPLVTRHLAFTPSDPLVPKQWYLTYSGF